MTPDPPTPSKVVDLLLLPILLLTNRHSIPIIMK